MTGTGFAYRTGRQKDKCPSFCQSSGVTARSANTPPRWMDNADSHRLEENITRKGEEVARKGRKLLKSTGKKETTTNLRHLLLPLTKPTHHLTRPPCPASCMGEEHSFPTNTPGTTSSSGVCDMAAAASHSRPLQHPPSHHPKHPTTFNVCAVVPFSQHKPTLLPVSAFLQGVFR